MTAGPLDMRSILAIAALFLSFFALFLAIFTVLNARMQFYKSTAGISGHLDKIANDINLTLTKIQALETGVETMSIRAHARGDSIKAETGSPAERAFVSAACATKARYGEFLQLVSEWSRLSSLRMQGAAASSCKEIGVLRRAVASSQRATTSEECFVRCATNVIEYAVEATDTKFRQKAPEAVDRVLRRMADFAGREFISPEKGMAWDVSLHDVLGRVAHGSNRPGTVAEVAIRGLRGGQKRLMKAKVLLYDD